jgi:hypothetical protein
VPARCNEQRSGQSQRCAHSYLRLPVPEDFPALELPPVVVPSQHGVPACDANHAAAFWTSWTILSHSVGRPFSTSKPGCTARAKEMTATKCRALKKAVITPHSESRKSWPGTAMTAPHARQRVVAIATHLFRLSRRRNFQPMLVRASDDGSRAARESVQCGEHRQTRRVAATSARWACFPCVISVNRSPNMPSHVRALFGRPARPQATRLRGGLRVFMAGRGSGAGRMSGGPGPHPGSQPGRKGSSGKAPLGAPLGPTGGCSGPLHRPVDSD